MSSTNNPPSSRPMTLRQQLPYTIDTDELGDFIRFFDGSAPIRGDKNIIHYLYDNATWHFRNSQEIAREATGKAIADFVLTDNFRNAGGDITKLSPVILGFTELTQKPEEEK